MNPVSSAKWLLAVGMACASTAAFAITPGEIPNSSRPDILQERMRLQDAAPEVSGTPLIAEEKPETTATDDDGPTFQLNGITLEGATAIGPAELAPLYANALGQNISLTALEAIAEKITAYYRAHGYILTSALLPPQRIAEGHVTIRVIEGFVSHVTLTGEGADDPLINAYAAKIREARPLTTEALERYLLLMEDLPGVEAHAVLEPSPDTQGATEVTIALTRKRFDFASSLDNRGNRYLGPVQMGLTGAINHALGRNDRTQLHFVTTPQKSDELRFLELRHEEPVGTEGTKLMVSASQVKTRSGFTLAPLDVVGASTAVSIGASHPLLRSRRMNWFVSGDFTLRNVDVDSLDQNVTYDKTRVLTVGSAVDFVDALAATNRLEVNVSQGLSIGTGVLGQVRSRANGEASFTKFTGRASRAQSLYGPISLYVMGAGQYSHQPLMASEEFAVGGSELGSAYDAGEISGDSGLGARAELQLTQSGFEYLPDHQLYSFYDIARVYNIDPVIGSESGISDLSSAGLGVRFSLNDSISGSLEGALPLTKKVAAFGADGSAPRLFFNLHYYY